MKRVLMGCSLAGVGMITGVRSDIPTTRARARRRKRKRIGMWN
jgi:hypothetical protein